MIGTGMVLCPIIPYIGVSWLPKVAELILDIPALEPVEFHVDLFVGIGDNLLSMRPSTVLLSVWMVVCGCGWPRSLSVLCMGTAVLEFKNNAPSFAAAADDITLQMVVDRLSTAPLIGGGFFVT